MASQTAQALEPSSHTVLKTPEEIPSAVQKCVDTIGLLARAKSSSEHQVALHDYDDDVLLDAPLFYVHGKEHVRSLYDILKMFANADFQANVVKFAVPSHREAQITVDGIFYVKPKRTLLLPVTYLFPQSVPMDVTLDLLVKSHNDKISKLSLYLHNLPKLPYLVRYFWGWSLSTAYLTAGRFVEVARDILSPHLQHIEWAKESVVAAIPSGLKQESPVS